MPAKKLKVAPSQRLWALFPLFCILLCALILRLVFFTGMVRGDDINYAHAAYELANGRTHFDYWPNGTFRIGLYAPVALLYAAFGPSDFSTLAFPLLSSLLTVLIIYAIGKLLDGEKAGLVAALLWACLPLDIFLASDLLADGPVAAFSATAVYLLLLAERAGPAKKRLWFVASGLCLIWAILIKPIAIVTSFLFLFYFALKSWPKLLSFLKRKSLILWLRSNSILATSAVLVGLFLLLAAYSLLQPRPLVVNLSRASTDFSQVLLTGETDIDLLSERVGQTSLFSILGPLFLVSVVVLLRERYAPARTALIWGGFYFLYYEWGPVGLNPLVYRPIINTEERSMLFTLVPLVVTAAIYLAKELPARAAQRAVIVSSGLVALGALTLGPALLNNAQFPVFVLLEILVIGSIVVSPLLAVYLKGQRRQLAAAALVALIAFALLKPALPYSAGYWQFRREEMQNFRLAAEFLIHRDGLVNMAAYSEATRLNYASGFKLGVDWAEEGRPDPGWRIRLGSAHSVKAEDYFLSLTELHEPLGVLHEVFRVGQAGQLIVIYQAGENNNVD